MGTDAPAILILDSSVLINFLRIERMDLLQKHAPAIVITEHVTQEITQSYPKEFGAFQAAISQGVVSEIKITDLGEIALMNHIRKRPGGKILGVGESSAIAVAAIRGYRIALDDKPAIRQIQDLRLNIKVQTTQDIVVSLIQNAHLSVPQADGIKADWAANHRFRLNFNSFSELLPHKS
jgi:predicted nucleic acid-binding protein